MIGYKLLTPGPLTTSDTVKAQMMVDHCTWDNDYKEITQEIRRELLEIAHVSQADYTTVLMQGSGSFGVESVLTSSVGEGEKLLILANGSYGQRMAQTMARAKRNFVLLECHYDQRPDPVEVANILETEPAITHVAMVHCETTSGILNDIESVGKVVKSAGRTFIVDAMSSFGGMDINMTTLGIDFIISSANKCIQGVPGFSFVLCKRSELAKCEGKATSLSLDLFDQWVEMEQDGKWRFTSPTHVVLAFAQALKELKAEGGVVARQARYTQNNQMMRDSLAKLGISSYVSAQHQSPIITTFFYPTGRAFSFEKMYNFIKERGYAIYPGKVTNADTFRIGNIGEIYPEDMKKLAEIFTEYFHA